MCGGAFGQFQNFRHNAQMGFGLIPKNSLTGKRVAFEASLEDSVAPDTQHGTSQMIKEQNAKAAAESAAKEAAAIADAKTQAEAAAVATQTMYDTYSQGLDQAAAADAQTKQTQSKSLLAQASSDDDAKNKMTSTKDTTTKTTLLGG